MVQNLHYIVGLLLVLLRKSRNLLRKFRILLQNHGFSESTGFRINNMAYCTDVIDFSKESFELLYGLDLLIIDCLRFKPHKTHAHLDKVLMWIDELKPKKSVLTYPD